MLREKIDQLHAAADQLDAAGGFEKMAETLLKNAGDGSAEILAGMEVQTIDELQAVGDKLNSHVNGIRQFCFLLARIAAANAR